MSSKLVKNDLLDLNSPDEAGGRELSAIKEAIDVKVTVLVSIPPSENGSAQIVSSELTMFGENPCLFVIRAEEICNKPSNTSDPDTLLNKEPELMVKLAGTVNYGTPHIYRTSVTGGALVLTIDMKEDLVVTHNYYPELKNTTIYLNFMFESYQSIEKNANSTDVFVNVQTLFTPVTPTLPPTTTLHSEQSGLSPLYGTTLLLLLVVFLFN
ncbi:uncharacterized protein LOC120977772 [Bufo bufo]|uniref:uncharacterized protein LOC120977772 n=1 Tax=Bufo bufo TaxID=8384 RepID=UPI001ABDE558|nr:uncharacterized protein LOC120977772 [Bufo bufo]